MADQDALLRDLAQFIRSFSDEGIARTVVPFNEMYPHAFAKDMDFETRIQWGRRDLDAIASALEENDPTQLNRNDLHGFMITQASAEMTPLFNFLEKIMFYARFITGEIWLTLGHECERAHQLMDCLEDFCVRAMRENTEAFFDVEFQPGVFAKTALLGSSAVNRSPRAADQGMAGAASVPEDLTEREREICDLIALGLTNKEIALRFDLSIGTVKNHVSRILAKLHLDNRTELAIWAARL